MIYLTRTLKFGKIVRTCMGKLNSQSPFLNFTQFPLSIFKPDFLLQIGDINKEKIGIVCILVVP
ncbi:unnamed protein product [Meloidogyne enterolobii]|uniref:Uncharacterized protein n=1 Tax=Meloidogyne enterolobii TaxID=390850 RepID=A0ACB0Z1X6_MELEN